MISTCLADMKKSFMSALIKMQLVGGKVLRWSRSQRSKESLSRWGRFEALLASNAICTSCQAWTDCKCCCGLPAASLLVLAWLGGLWIDLQSLESKLRWSSIRMRAHRFWDPDARSLAPEAFYMTLHFCSENKKQFRRQKKEKKKTKKKKKKKK